MKRGIHWRNTVSSSLFNRFILTEKLSQNNRKQKIGNAILNGNENRQLDKVTKQKFEVVLEFSIETSH